MFSFFFFSSRGNVISTNRLLIESEPTNASLYRCNKHSGRDDVQLCIDLRFPNERFQVCRRLIHRTFDDERTCNRLAVHGILWNVRSLVGRMRGWVG